MPGQQSMQTQPAWDSPVGSLPPPSYGKMTSGGTGYGEEAGGPTGGTDYPSGQHANPWWLNPQMSPQVSDPAYGSGSDPSTLGGPGGGRTYAFGLAGQAERGAESSQQVTNEQTWANRPDQENAFGSSLRWEQGPDGRWRQVQSFGGQMGSTVGSLQDALSKALSSPLDLSGLPQVESGEAARDKAIESAYGQATSRLNPQWQQREQAMASQRANQGLDPNSQAYRSAMRAAGQERNDAYGGAMSSAIAQGREAGESVFRTSSAARQQALTEALKQRGLPMEELQAMQGFLQQPGFQQAGRADPTNYLQAAIAQGAQGLGQQEFDLRRRLADEGMGSDVIAGIMRTIASIAGLSDARAKTDIDRHGPDVLPGVPLASWTWRAGGGRETGVIAQDLQRVAPELVSVRPDGYLGVHYAALWKRVHREQ